MMLVSTGSSVYIQQQKLFTLVGLARRIVIYNYCFGICIDAFNNSRSAKQCTHRTLIEKAHNLPLKIFGEFSIMYADLITERIHQVPIIK